MNPKLQEKLLEVYENKTLTEMLRLIDLAGVFVAAYGLFYLTITLLEDAWLLALKVLGILAIPFLILSIVRRLIDAPRPYELLDFYEKKPRARRGRSFPSRHAYSVFAIGSVLLYFHPLFGALVLALGAMLAIARVLLGLHFPRDVIVGGICGVLAVGIGLPIVLLL